MNPVDTDPVFQPAAATRLERVKEYYFSTKLREIARMNQDGGRKVINLGIGSPDLPPHPEVIEALTEAAAVPSHHGYQSYTGLPELRRAFAHWYRRWFAVELEPDSEILPLIGSKEGIMHIAMAFLEEGTEALVPDPGYPTYRAACRLAGAEVRSYLLREQKDWRPDLEALQREDLSRVRLMWLNYPHMPTGATADPGFFRELIAFARTNGILLVNDNPYGFILQDRPLSLLAQPGAREVAMELNSLSKSHNMAGWRVGMLAGRAKLLREVLRFKSNMDSGMFKPLQLAAVRALGLDQSWYEAQNSVYRDRRKKVYELLAGLGCPYDERAGGLFVWARCPQGDGFALSDQVLARSRVFLTPGGIFGEGGQAYIRISLCQPEAEIERAIDRMAEAGLFSGIENQEK